ncbi:MAG: CBS domain-containing protein [Deltaproteobacteria bacterium]|nr:CBS domain-containing protein [Deltaproteobacteria bacterium]
MTRQGMHVSAVMTRGAHTISRDQSLESAHHVMDKFHVRHLPVMDHGKVAGMVSEHDLYLLETLRETNAFDVRVENAMSADPYTVSPNDPLYEVCDEMARNRYGAAIVVEHGRVVGIFTAVDALRVLSDMLREPTPDPATRQ